MLRRTSLALVAAFLLTAAPAAAKDYAPDALNIIPSGQYGSVPIPAGADQQALMYDGLTPLFDQVTAPDLTKYFKSEALGAAGSPGPTTTEATPRKGVTIVRDAFNVPHITGKTRDDVTWAAGWVLEEDRGLLLAQGRYPARFAALDAPGINAFGLVTGLKTVTVTKQADRIIDRAQTSALKAAGKEGRGVLHDVDVYVKGINARLKFEKSSQKPWTRVDVYSINALAGQIFGQGGGDETRRSQFLDALTKRLGASKAKTIFDDLSEHMDEDTPTTISKRFPYEKVPAKATGNAIIDAASTSAKANRAISNSAKSRRYASNFLMVSANRSATGHPLFVAGPQIGYFYPGLTLEMDLKGPGVEARGAAMPGGAGNILIGRGQDHAWSLTSAGSDTNDQFVETLCGGSDAKYMYKGKCRKMGSVNAGTIAGAGGGAVKYRTTVHGPVLGYANSKGKRVAITFKRSSYGKDILWQLMFKRLTTNKVSGLKSFYAAAATSPFTFNVAYADDKNIATYSAGALPIRDKRVDPRLPTIGTGKYEWKGFLKPSGHPHQANPDSGKLVNWNNKPAPGFGASDSEWSYGSIHRVQMLNAGIDAKQIHDLASVTSAMNKAATQDLRDTGTFLDALTGVLDTGGPAPSARALKMEELLKAWRGTGSSRLDRDLDGKMDAGAAPAIMDAIYPKVVDAAFEPVLGPQLPLFSDLEGHDISGGFTGGRINQIDKDLRQVAGQQFKTPFKTKFCGNGDLAACRASLWAAIESAGSELAAAQGSDDPEQWTSDANAERITFAPGILPTTIRFTNRPSGIQQVISFSGHRTTRK
jgi:acyl-homoserine lactone acylase PvdQ